MYTHSKYLRNKKSILKAVRTWQSKNKNKLKEYDLKYYKKNRLKRLNYYYLNKEELKEKHKQYYLKNIEKIKKYYKMYRERKRNESRHT
jgi:hypothetical protein